MKPTLFTDLRDQYIEELAKVYASNNTEDAIEDAKESLCNDISVDCGNKLYLTEQGFAIYCYWVDCVWISHLYIAPEYRKKGYAENMIDEIQKSEGYPVALYCHKNNTNAQTFYERIGFRKPKLTPNYNFDNNKFDEYILYRRDNIPNGFIADIETTYRANH